MDVLNRILGDENISALDLKELGDRFNTSMMFGKLANIGDDIGDDFLQGSQVSIFKKIVTGNRIKAERKDKTHLSSTHTSNCYLLPMTFQE